MANILVVEDNSAISELLSMQMEDLGHAAFVAPDLQSARSLFADAEIDAVLLDYQLPDGSGMDLLQEIKSSDPNLPIIMVTGVGDTALAIEAMKEGAYDFIRKPMDEVELKTTLGNALNTSRLSRKVATITSSDDYQVSVGSIIGQSHAVIQVCKTIGRVAESDTSVLITGECGTGKEVVAKALHHHSSRPGLFIPVNCSAIVETLLESELFGHEKGSFTGAHARKEGKFEVANDGTLFLDEIGEMPLALQPKLLRVLQERSFERVGGHQTLQTSARIIAATNRDLSEMVKDKGFREDLFYRLNIVTIHLPPLRERMEDLPLLTEHLLHKNNIKLHKAIKGLTNDAWSLLNQYSWPGNVRELENVLARAVVLAPGDTITSDLLSIGPDGGGSELAHAERADEPELISLEQIEARQVQAILTHTRWHKGKACEILGISRPALERKIVKYGLS